MFRHEQDLHLVAKLATIPDKEKRQHNWATCRRQDS